MILSSNELMILLCQRILELEGRMREQHCIGFHFDYSYEDPTIKIILVGIDGQEEIFQLQQEDGTSIAYPFLGRSLFLSSPLQLCELTGRENN